MYRASLKDESPTEAAKSMVEESKDALKEGAAKVEGKVKEVVS